MSALCPGRLTSFSAATCGLARPCGHSPPQTLVLFEPDTTAHIMSNDCGSPPHPSCHQDDPLKPASVGPGNAGWFKSEFGCSVWASFESVSPLLAESEWGLHTAAMYEHNWPADNVIRSYWGDQQNLNATGAVAFKRQLYQSMVGQALFISAEVIGWRSSNLWGTLIWQFNEIWPTGRSIFCVLFEVNARRCLRRMYVKGSPSLLNAHRRLGKHRVRIQPTWPSHGRAVETPPLHPQTRRICRRAGLLLPEVRPRRQLLPEK